MANQSGSRIGSAILIVGLFIGGSLWVFGHAPATAVHTARFSATVPAGDSIGGVAGSFPIVAISPDGQHIAYVATHDGLSQMYLRSVTEFTGVPIAGTAGAHTPFFSPDSQWLGAIVEHQVVKFPVAGGKSTVMCRIPYEIYGAYWGDTWIYFGAATPLGLVKIPAYGGEPLGATALDDDHGERDHRYPEALPGGNWLLFAARSAGQSFDEAQIVALSLKTGKRKTVLKGGTYPRYIASGHLAFVRGGKLMAVPFDPINAELHGEPVAMVDGVNENPMIGAGQYAVSADGTLVYSLGSTTAPEREIVLVDRSGAARVLSTRKQAYEEVVISPDGRQLAVTQGDRSTDIWIHDIATGAQKQFTTDGERLSPVWHPDGKHMLYGGYTGKPDAEFVMFQKSLDGTGAEQSLRVSETPVRPWFTSADGHALLYEETGRSGRTGTQMMMIDGSRLFRNLTLRDYDKNWAQFSPDGHWVAFNTDESGQQEVYVETYPEAAALTKVSTGGGIHPQWSHDGKELFFLNKSSAAAPRPFAQRVSLMAATFEAGPTPHIGTPHMLFQGPFLVGGHDYAISADSKGFIMIRESQAAQQSTELNVVLNWAGELKHRVPGR